MCGLSCRCRPLNVLQASRRAAASFFFELLVLGTRDCVQLEQTGSFKDIAIQGKDKLWQQSQRHAMDV